MSAPKEWLEGQPWTGVPDAIWHPRLALSIYARGIYAFLCTLIREKSGRAAWPSLQTIGESTGIGSDNTIRKGLNDLVKLNALEVRDDGGRRADGTFSSRTYIVNPPHKWNPAGSLSTSISTGLSTAERISAPGPDAEPGAQPDAYMTRSKMLDRSEEEGGAHAPEKPTTPLDRDYEAAPPGKMRPGTLAASLRMHAPALAEEYAHRHDAPAEPAEEEA